jgi:two-component system nitrogen regulation sensor histidine kinase GlnL
VPGSERVSLPLEFCVRDNGPGVPDDCCRILFDPFVTTKPNGSASAWRWSPRSSATMAA